MGSCLCKMCHCLCDNFPPCQHQQCHVTTLSAPTTPNSQPHHYKVKGPKSKLSNIVFFVLLTVLHRFATIDIAHPCSIPTLSVPSICHLCPLHVVCALHMLSVPSTCCLCCSHIVCIICALHTLSVPSICRLCPPYIICALHTSAIYFI